jgi:hypothetical protein
MDWRKVNHGHAGFLPFAIKKKAEVETSAFSL